jgi:hypothetical protein
MMVIDGGDGKDDDCHGGGDDDHITHITAYKLNTSHAMLCYAHKDINISDIIHSHSGD